MSTDKVNDINKVTRGLFESNLVQALTDFVEIPNLSRFFDGEYNTNGLLEKACQYCIDWAEKLDVKGLSVKLYKEEGRLTPFMFGVIEGTKTDPKNVIAYGHIDKQPHLTEDWSEGLHPTKPVIKDGYMYGRGANDDGYAFFSAVAFAKISQMCGIPHDRIVLFFETDEESASCDLEFYLDFFKEQIGKPDLFLCLDSGTPAYDRFATTVSLRGVLEGTVKVKVTKQSTHSGMNGGIIPDSFRILRMLLARIEDPATGKLCEGFSTKLPEDKAEFAKAHDKNFAKQVFSGLPTLDGLVLENDTSLENYISNIWGACLHVTGMEGFPTIQDAGNVIRPYTKAKISIRVSPDIDVDTANALVKTMLEKDAPYGAEVTVEMEEPGAGWSCPPLDENLKSKMMETSQKFWGQEMAFFGVGGSIPFVNLLSSKYPETVLFVGGVAGPNSNAHGPDENLNMEYWEKFTAAMTWMLSEL